MLNPNRKLSQDPVFKNLLLRDRLVVLRSPLDESDATQRNGTASLDTVAAALAARLPANYLALSLDDAKALPLATPPGVVPNTLYGITGNWNATTTPATVFVHGVRPDAYHQLGIVYDAQAGALVVLVDVAAGTYKKLSADDLLPKNNTWTGLNNFEVGQINLGPNVGVSWNDNYEVAAVTATGGYASFQASDVIASTAPFAFNSITKLAGAVGNLGLQAGARILWVRGGLNSYSPQRGNPLRPYQTLAAAQTAALPGDLLYVEPGGTGVDAFGRATYTEDFIWSKEVRILFAPGAIWAGLFQCNSFLGGVASSRVLVGGEFLGRVIQWRQLNVESSLLVRGARFTGLGTFEVNGTGTANDSVFGRAVLRNCEFDSKLPAGSMGPVRVIGRDDMGPNALELDNTLAMSANTAVVTFQANSTSRLVLRGTTELRGPQLYDNRVTSPGMVLIPQSQWLQDLRPSGDGSGAAGGSISFVTTTYTAPGDGQQIIAPADMPGLAQATEVMAVRLRDFTEPTEPEAQVLPTSTWSFDTGTHTLTVLATAGILGDDVLEIDYLTGSGGGPTYTAGAGITISPQNEISTNSDRVYFSQWTINPGQYMVSTTTNASDDYQYYAIAPPYKVAELLPAGRPGYDPATGIFTVPYNGIYDIRVTGGNPPGALSPGDSLVLLITNGSGPVKPPIDVAIGPITSSPFTTSSLNSFQRLSAGQQFRIGVGAITFQPPRSFEFSITVTATLYKFLN